MRVTTEIGRLRRVLVHEPGPEVDLMAPGMMEELLFDDILFGDRAREEHAIFRRVLRLLGVDVVEVRILLEETLSRDDARRWLIETVFQDVPARLRRWLLQAPAPDLTGVLIEGLRRWSPESEHGAILPAVQDTKGTATEDLCRDLARAGWNQDQGGALRPDERSSEAGLYHLAPLPNWCFQRDPQIVIGSGVVFAAMATPARHLEGMLARAIFRHHPDFALTPVLAEPLDTAHHQHLFTDPALPRLEGGDVLLFSPELLAVGLSERTSRSAVLRLARSLSAVPAGPRWLLAIEIPKRRAYMHLDTLVTPIDRDVALAFTPVIAGPGPELARAWEIDLKAKEIEVSPVGTLLEALRRRGLDFEPIPCGGRDPLFQQREQWTDGANALAVAPGIILLYDRNVRTAEELSRRGFRVVPAIDLLTGRAEIEFDRGERTCILVPSHELSRARGGPHCLSHPLVRDDLT